MTQRLTRHVMAMAIACISLPVLCTQAVAQQGASQPAPRRDISGIWQPARALDGIQPNGARDMPADGKHEPPYTAAGLEMFKRNRPSNGTTEVGPAEENDPAHQCDPQGFPRENLFELRATQVIHNPIQTILLYTYGKIWRTIWTDGRELPKDPDPRWFGYSVGKWQDDYTFVVQTVGMDERTWIDNSGRPHSEDLRVEEVFHRVDRDHLELTMTIEDPKIYSKPWVALNKLPMTLLPANFEISEMMCSPSELAEYNKRHATKGGSVTPNK